MNNIAQAGVVTLPTDRMAEAEVALLLAEYLLTLPDAEGPASVAIDGASVKVGEAIIFPISDYLSGRGWIATPGSKARSTNVWACSYVKAGMQMDVHSRSGVGDVVVGIKGRRVIAECKKGPLIRKAGSPEYSLLATALGQALMFEANVDDIVVVALPDSPDFRRLVAARENRAPLKRSGIRICLVARDGSVTGFRQD